ncbi:Nucleolar GTP-binding protein 1 [Polyrhizophydium stewartii]|uniref:Nucleolar GTP-binding protein 1 n=1 Tax=Polyrhizophydium stewartii TaxID=2732419 RepID=A0ABR4NC99_9FUNG|nr:Nucleolar GTP-binding protein 1 [Polyrhizophydium stewartii]
MASHYNFKKVQVVPTASEFVDIVLSKINRKTPTVVHPNYQISRIRQFYMRKVKFGQDCFDEKLNQILADFPKLDEIHPFYADLMNVLYDRDHYKLALAQINTARHLIDAVAKDYARLLKFGDSLFRCKQLKKAALGRMATIMKRQKDSLAYLEQVRQHLSRLPSIDPNTRTLIICGYPNVGKSSFMNKLTRAEVEVQPYAFTTKSLFVGHMDYKYLRWQVIDTPGILDHPLEQRNTIEMQSITALAHLRACIMFFLDLSEQCGYSVAQQLALYHSIKPLFANKPTMLVVNKIDVRRPEDLGPEDKAKLDEILSTDDVSLVQLSCYTDEGVMDVRNAACDKLLASRVEMKLKGAKVSTVVNKLHLAQPVQRDDVERPAFIPEAALSRKKYDPTDPDRRKLAKDIEAENGGAGVFSVDLKAPYMLANDEWKYDTIPEIMDGKNLADFIDPEIEAKLDALEREEERLIAEGFYESDNEMPDEDEEEILTAAEKVREKKELIRMQNREKKSKNSSALPKKAVARMSRLEDFESHLAKIGNKGDVEALRSRSRARKRTHSEAAAGEGEMEVDAPARSKSRGPSVMRDRSVMGLRNVKQKVEAENLKKKAQKMPNLYAKRGEADREIQVKRPKHLYTGKRGMGKTDRR